LVLRQRVASPIPPAESPNAFENPGGAAGTPSSAAPRLHVEIQRVKLLTVRYALLAIRNQIKVAAANARRQAARKSIIYTLVP